jgi:hypothetical protein
MYMLACVTDDHGIVPRKGSARRVRNGQPADLRNPAHYPVTAVCQVCRRRIHCERWLRAEWYHLPDELS